MVRQRKLNTPEKRARVGERIKVAATQAGYSLKELAEQAGVAPSVIYQYVRGITAVPISLLDNIAAVTRVHTSFFDPEQDARQTLALPIDAPHVDPGTAVSVAETGTRSRIEGEMRQARALAEACAGSRTNRAAYLSALEQMVVLSRALDRREQHAGILARMGRARLEDGQLALAYSNLMEARDLLGQEVSETTHRVTLDLALCHAEREEYAEAARVLEEITAVEASPARWRAEILLGQIRYRYGDYPGALLHYGQAAESVLAQNSPQSERDAQSPLAMALAQLAYGIGHFEASRSLWSYAARRAERDRDSAVYLQAVTELARCEEARGDLAAARCCLQQVTVLTAFWEDDEKRQVVARGLLARVQAAVGAEDNTRENARLALRIAHRNGKIADNIAASIALAQIRIASKQFTEALEYGRDAVDLARRSDRAADLASAHLLTAAACCGEHATRRGDSSPAAEAALRRALVEAKAAADAADRGRDLLVRLQAQWMIADLYAAMGAEREAEAALDTFLNMVNAGPAGFKAFLNTGTNSLLALLSAEIDLPALLQASGRLDLPLIEWQVHTLRGLLAASRKNLNSAYDSFLQAAQVVWRVMCGLTPAEAYAFHRRNPRLSDLLDGLEQTAIAAGARDDVRTLLERIQLSIEERGAAIVGAKAVPVG
jgi:transcriptional regulator with XRE-family HTH domain